jgi:Na+-driven multidrug efflux pump
MLMALSPTVAHAVGGGRDAEAGGYFRQALWLSVAVSAVVLLGLAFLAEAALVYMGAMGAFA